MIIDDDQMRALTGHRATSWRYDILNLQDQKIGEMQTVSGANFDMSIFTTIRTSGALTCTEVLKWLKVRIQPWYTVVSPTGIEISWPIGVFIPATPGADYKGDGKHISVELYDKLLILDQDKYGDTYSVPAGTNVTTRIKQILASVGDFRNTVFDSSETLRSGQVFEPNTSKLTVINELLKAIGYFSLDVDGYGVFHAEQYVAPALRGIEWTFADDEFSIYSSDFAHQVDLFNVPNRVTQISVSDGEVPALVSTVENNDPASDYSIPSRERVISETETEVEASSQAVLDGIAMRRLREMSAVTSTYQIETALIPLGLNDTVAFKRDAEGISILGTVQAMSFSTEVGALVSTTIREVTP